MRLHAQSETISALRRLEDVRHHPDDDFAKAEPAHPNLPILRERRCPPATSRSLAGKAKAVLLRRLHFAANNASPDSARHTQAFDMDMDSATTEVAINLRDEDLIPPNEGMQSP
jgi:hypothetical protein